MCIQYVYEGGLLEVETNSLHHLATLNLNDQNQALSNRELLSFIRLAEQRNMSHCAATTDLLAPDVPTAEFQPGPTILLSLGLQLC